MKKNLVKIIKHITIITGLALLQTSFVGAAPVTIAINCPTTVIVNERATCSLMASYSGRDFEGVQFKSSLSDNLSREGGLIIASGFKDIDDGDISSREPGTSPEGSVTFASFGIRAKSEGPATVTITNLRVVDGDYKYLSLSDIVANITVVKANATPSTSPAPSNPVSPPPSSSNPRSSSTTSSGSSDASSTSSTDNSDSGQNKDRSGLASQSSKNKTEPKVTKKKFSKGLCVIICIIIKLIIIFLILFFLKRRKKEEEDVTEPILPSDGMLATEADSSTSLAESSDVFNASSLNDSAIPSDSQPSSSFDFSQNLNDQTTETFPSFSEEPSSDTIGTDPDSINELLK